MNEAQKKAFDALNELGVAARQQVVDKFKKVTKDELYVTTNDDLWNDSFGFYLQKGEVKKLPKLNDVIAHALEQGLLREVSGVGLEEAKKEGRFIE